jgi:glycosyltransferase involved in cell wall biosynthesis
LTKLLNNLPRKNQNDSPLVSLIVLTYNHEDYVQDAVRSAIAQNYYNLEIIISDDLSTDNTKQIIVDVLQQTTRRHVSLRENIKNLGLAGHINEVMKIARGKLIVVASGDDVSNPTRVTELVTYWINNGAKSCSIFSRYRMIDEKGNIYAHRRKGSLVTINLTEGETDSIDSIIVGTSGCTQAWTRDLIDNFEPLDPNILHEDITIPLRALLVGSVVYLPQELVDYRFQSGSLSRPSFVGSRDRFAKMAKYWHGRLANYKQFFRDQEASKKMRYDQKSSIQQEWISGRIATHAAVALRYFRFFSGTVSDRFAVVFERGSPLTAISRMKLLIICTLPCMYGIQRRFKVSRKYFYLVGKPPKDTM